MLLNFKRYTFSVLLLMLLTVSIESNQNPVVKISDKQQVLTTPIIGKDGTEMMLIPAGEFIMGAPDSEGNSDEHPQHKVYLNFYYIDKCEVTNKQFKKFVNATRYKTIAEKSGGGWVWNANKWEQKNSADWTDPLGDGSGILKKMDYPVVQISWYDAVAYAKWVGKRLPTEAEWEKACRAETTTGYCFGNDESELIDYAWYSENSDERSHTVCEKKPNKWGIYDMHGNVWEWCVDWYDSKYYANSFMNNSQGPNNGTYRVIRGGSWYDFGCYCRSAIRLWSNPTFRNNITGFRCVVSNKDK